MVIHLNTANVPLVTLTPVTGGEAVVATVNIEEASTTVAGLMTNNKVVATVKHNVLYVQLTLMLP